MFLIVDLVKLLFMKNEIYTVGNNFQGDNHLLIKFGIDDNSIVGTSFCVSNCLKNNVVEKIQEAINIAFSSDSHLYEKFRLNRIPRSGPNDL